MAFTKQSNDIQIPIVTTSSDKTKDFLPFVRNVGGLIVWESLQMSFDDFFEMITTSTKFTELTDAPRSYTGQANKIPKVKSTEDELIFSRITEDVNGLVLINKNTSSGADAFSIFNSTVKVLNVTDRGKTSIFAKTADGSFVFEIYDNNSTVAPNLQIRDNGNIHLVGNRYIDASLALVLQSGTGNPLYLSSGSIIYANKNIAFDPYTNGILFGTNDTAASRIVGNGTTNYFGLTFVNYNAAHGNTAINYLSDGSLGINTYGNNLFEIFNPKGVTGSDLLGYIVVDVTNLSKTVTLNGYSTGVDFRKIFKHGDKINIQPSPPYTFTDTYTVDTIDSATQITLTANYTGATGGPKVIQIDATSQSYGSPFILGRHGNLLLKEGSSASITASEKLEVEGNIKLSGIIKLTGLTSTQIGTLTPNAGDIVYNTTTNKHQGYNGSTWNDLY